MLIEARNLDIQIGQKAILQGINLTIEQGQIITIIGPNGSGKSTLLKALIGALPPSQGKIVRSPDLSIGYVPQRLHIDQTLPLTVKRFLNLPLKFSSAQTEDAIRDAGIASYMNQQIHSLSGGQLQRVLLARALLNNPNLLLLDEPTQGLDRKGTADFYRRLELLRQKLNCAIILVSHDLLVVMRQSDRVICINGHICCQGAPEEVGSSEAFRELFGIEDDVDSLALYKHHPLNQTQETRHAG